MWLGRVFVGGNLESLEDPGVGYICEFLVVYLPGLLTGTSYNWAGVFFPMERVAWGLWTDCLSGLLAGFCCFL